MTRIRPAALFGFVVLALLTLLARPAAAHKPSDAYLQLTVSGAQCSGRWDIAIRDLDHVLDLDANGDARVTWGELRARSVDVTTLAATRLALRDGEGPCATTFEPMLAGIVQHSDGPYAVLRFASTCPSPPTSLGVDYHLFFDVDPQHRGLLRVETRDVIRTATFAAGHEHAEVSLEGQAVLAALRRNVTEGVLHIWKGYDHVLFLFALLLPCVLRREGGTWVAVSGLRPALLDVLRIVTAFTVSHSITLSLAALGVVTLPSRLVESTIAASVVLAAVNNLRPILREDRWMAAFLLGLMHGFGFAATLDDLELPRSALVTTLLGFNLGVELGQVAIVALFVPLAYAARHTRAYRRVAVFGGSVVIAALALVWLVERAFEVRLVS
jgi:hypothetical protein